MNGVYESVHELIGGSLIALTGNSIEYLSEYRDPMHFSEFREIAYSVVRRAPIVPHRD